MPAAARAGAISSDVRQPDAGTDSPAAVPEVPPAQPDEKALQRESLARDEKSCEAGDGGACVRAAATHRLASKHLDAVFLAYLSHRGCSGGLVESCSETLLAMAGAPEIPGARSRFEDMCKHDNPNGCYALAGIEMGFYGGSPDMTAAGERLTALCDQGLAVACHDLAVFFSAGPDDSPDVDKAIPLLKKACDAGWPASCQALDPAI